MSSFDEIMENIIAKRDVFSDKEIGYEMYMIENMLFIKDYSDNDTETQSIVNNYIISLNKKVLRTLHPSETEKTKILLDMFKKFVESKGNDLSEVIDFIRKMKPVSLGENLTCHRILS